MLERCGPYSYFLVHVVCTLCAFSTFMLMPLKSEFIFKKVAELHNITHKVVTDCKSNNTTSAIDQLVAKEVSKWTLEFDMTMFIPAAFAGIIVTSWGDRVGRKLAMTIPVVGILLSNAFFATAVYLDWPLKAFFIYNFVAGLGGYYMTLLMQGYAYLSDITPNESRGIRMVILDTCLGVGGGVSGVISGYWIDSQGFFAPVLACTILVGVGLLIIPFLPDSRVLRSQMLDDASDDDATVNNNDVDVIISRSASSSSITSDYGSFDRNGETEKKQKHAKKKGYNLLDLLRSVWNVYSSEYSHCDQCCITRDQDNNVTKISPSSEVCPHGGGRYPGRVWRMWFYLISYDFAMFVNVGTQTFTTIYLLSQPLCFNPVLVGIQSGMKFMVIGFTPVVIIIYQRCLGFSNNMLIIVCFFGWVAYTMVMSFATETFVVFIATATLAFGNAQTSFIKAQMSNLVSEFEHGASFALLSSSEIITFLLSTISFLTLYSATISIYHGFVWLFAATVLVIPILLITCVWYADRQRDKMSSDDERKSLIS